MRIDLLAQPFRHLKWDPEIKTVFNGYFHGMS